MAFSKVDNQRRLNLHKALCTFAHFEHDNGKKLMVVSMNDDGTEFDLVAESSTDGIDGLVTIDSKCRVCFPSWLGVVNPGDTFKITAYQGRIHLKLVQQG